MEVLKFIGLVWLFLSVVVLLFGIIGYFVETKTNEDSKLKKWWRKNIIAPDPDDENKWKNFNG